MSNYSNAEQIREGFATSLKPQASYSEAPNDEVYRDASARHRGDTSKMNDLTREELRATLSDIENQMEKRVDRMERDADRRTDAYRQEQEARQKLYAERFEAMYRRLEDRDKVIDSKLDTIASRITGVQAKVEGYEAKIDDSVEQVRKSNRSTLGGMITIGIAIILGVWGVNSTIISSASGIFTSGQDSQKTQQANEKVLKDTQELLQQIKLNQASAPTK